MNFFTQLYTDLDNMYVSGVELKLQKKQNKKRN